MFFSSKNRSEKIFLNFGRAQFFMLHITQQQWMLRVGVLLLNPILIINSDCFCPYTSKKSVLHCEMAGSVMESEASELKWWLPFWGCIPSTWQQNRNVCIARHSHDLYFQCLNCLILWKTFKSSRDKLSNWIFRKRQLLLVATRNFVFLSSVTSFSSRES